MTADEEFERWCIKEGYTGLERLERDLMKKAYLAAREATAKRCVEICDSHIKHDHGHRTLNAIAIAIKKEFL